MIKPKVGVVSCSGECCSLGTLSRIATRRVLEDIKVGETVTICLPLFLAGDSGERMFAQQFPTVAVDGCKKHCATEAIEKYSGKAAATVDVEFILKEHDSDPPASRRLLTPEDMDTVDLVAGAITEKVDLITGAQDA